MTLTRLAAAHSAPAACPSPYQSGGCGFCSGFKIIGTFRYVYFGPRWSSTSLVRPWSTISRISR